jgi:hypothetical protein
LIVPARFLPLTPILVTLMKEALSSSETWFLQERHGVTSQTTPFFIVTAEKTSSLTGYGKFHRDIPVSTAIRQILLKSVTVQGAGVSTMRLVPSISRRCRCRCIGASAGARQCLVTVCFYNPVYCSMLDKQQSTQIYSIYVRWQYKSKLELISRTYEVTFMLWPLIPR